MSNDKEIRIRAVLDAGTFDKGVNEIQEKLKKLTQQQQQGAATTKTLGKDSVLGKYAQQAFGDFSKESQKQLETMYQTQRREAVNQSITMKGKEAELAKMAKIDGEMTKQQKERMELLKKEIDLLKEKQRITLANAAETQKALDKIKPEVTPPGGGPGGPGEGGGQPPQDPSGGFKNMLGGMLKQVGVAAIIKGAINGAVTGIEDIITRDRKIAMNNAASMNMASREMREQFQGQGSRGTFWMPERQRAMQAAATEQGRQSTLETAKAWGGTALQGIGIGTMALTGWTGIGLGVGAGLAGAGTMLKGGIVGDERSRAAMFDRTKFNSMMTKEGLEKYEQNLAAEKAKDPRRQMAREYFEENRQDIMAMQKLMGVNDSQLMGTSTDREGVTRAHGLLQQNMGYGKQFGGTSFSQATIEQQAQALASGGAMTEGIRDLSGAAATYNRQFNLSNAGQTMGRMQGNAGMNSAQTDMAYQRLLAEAVRQGVDTSTMPRELEKMTQITAELSTAGGVNATQMTELFGQGLYGFDQKSMQAAAGAAQEFKDTAKTAGGWEGQMGMGFLQSGKAKELLGGKSLSAKDMNYINQLSAAEMGEQDFQSVGEYLGIDAEKAKELIKEKDKYKQGRTAEEDKANKDLGEFLKAKGPMTREERDEALSTGEGAKLFRAAEATRGQTHGDFMQKDPAQRRAEILMQANVAAENQPGIDLETAEAKVQEQKKKTEERAGFVEEGAVATGDMARMEALNEQLDNLKTAARNHTKYAEEYNKQFELLITATKTGADAMDSVAKQLTGLEQRMRENDAMSGNVPSGKPPGSR
jgi:hypothetical protein